MSEDPITYDADQLPVPLPFKGWSLTQDQLLPHMADWVSIKTLVRELAPADVVDEDVITTTIQTLVDALVRKGMVRVSPILDGGDEPRYKREEVIRHQPASPPQTSPIQDLDHLVDSLTDVLNLVLLERAARSHWEGENDAEWKKRRARIVRPLLQALCKYL